MYEVLIVEDEDLERHALRNILLENIEEIHICGEARSGAEAIQIINNIDVDLILVDINIPKINGIDVVRHLRGVRADTKVIITTAYDFFELTRAALQLKVDEYLLKPIRTQNLLDAVRACLRALSPRRRCQATVRHLVYCLDQGMASEGKEAVSRYIGWACEQESSPPYELLGDLVSTMNDALQAKGYIASDTLENMITISHSSAGGRSTCLEFISKIQEGIDGLFMGAEENYSQPSDVVRKALEYIDDNLSRGVTLEQTAAHAEVSSWYLSRVFKKKMNINFVSYLTNKRIDLAKSLLLKTDLSIMSVAAELSFSDVSYFCKTFKKEVGVSPSNYRKSGGTPGSNSSDAAS